MFFGLSVEQHILIYLLLPLGMVHILFLTALVHINEVFDIVLDVDLLLCCHAYLHEGLKVADGTDDPVDTHFLLELFRSLFTESLDFFDALLLFGAQAAGTNWHHHRQAAQEVYLDPLGLRVRILVSLAFCVSLFLILLKQVWIL
jgi:hypothetical protein